MLLQNGEDVLEEVELFVTRARPEIVAMNDERLLFFVASFVNNGHAALLSERRISQHHRIRRVCRRARPSPSPARASHQPPGRVRPRYREARDSCSKAARRYRPARHREAVRCLET